MRQKVYICHPYSGDVAKNKEKVIKICRRFFENGSFPIAPQIYLDQFVDEESEREIALEFCTSLLHGCDVMFVFGNILSSGMKVEMEYAMRNNIKIAFASESYE